MKSSDFDGILTVSVLEARNLPKRKSTEYHIELAVGDPAEGEPSSDKYVKTALAGGAAPDWNQAFTFPINAQLKSLYGYMYRTRRATEKYVGRFVIDFDRMIEEQRISDKWFSVWDKSSTIQKQLKFGEIHLVLLFARNVTVESGLGCGELVADKHMGEKESEARFPTRKVAGNCVVPALEDSATQTPNAAATLPPVSPFALGGLVVAWKGHVPGTVFDVNGVRAVMRGDSAVSDVLRKEGAGSRLSRRPDSALGLDRATKDAAAGTLDAVPGVMPNQQDARATSTPPTDTPPADNPGTSTRHAAPSQAEPSAVAVRCTSYMVVDGLMQQENSYVDIAREEIERDRQLYYHRLAASHPSTAARHAPGAAASPLLSPPVHTPDPVYTTTQHARGPTLHTRHPQRDLLPDTHLLHSPPSSASDPHCPPVNSISTDALGALPSIAATGALDAAAPAAHARENAESGREESHKSRVEVMLGNVELLGDFCHDEHQQTYYECKAPRTGSDSRGGRTSADGSQPTEDTDDRTSAASRSSTRPSAANDSSRASSVIDFHAPDSFSHQPPVIPPRPQSLPPLTPSASRFLRPAYAVVSEAKTKQPRPSSPAALSWSSRPDAQSGAAYGARDSRLHSLNSAAHVEPMEQLNASFDPALHDFKSSSPYSAASVSASGPGRPVDPHDMFQIALDSCSPHQSESSQVQLRPLYPNVNRHPSPHIPSTPSPPFTSAPSNKDASVKASWEPAWPATAAV